MLLVFLFCAAFHEAPLTLNASWVGGYGGGGGGGGTCTFLYPALLVAVFWLALLSVSLFLVCFLGVVHMSQPVAGLFHTQM